MAKIQCPIYPGCSNYLTLSVKIGEYPYRRRIRRGCAYREALGKRTAGWCGSDWWVAVPAASASSCSKRKLHRLQRFVVPMPPRLGGCRQHGTLRLSENPKRLGAPGSHRRRRSTAHQVLACCGKTPYFDGASRAYDVAKCAPDCGGTAKAVENLAAMPSTNVPESVVADIGAQRRLTTLIARSLFQRSASPADYGRALAQASQGE